MARSATRLESRIQSIYVFPSDYNWDQNNDNKTGPKITYAGSPRSVMLDSVPGVGDQEGDPSHVARFQNAEGLGEDWIENNELDAGGGGGRTKRAVSMIF